MKIAVAGTGYVGMSIATLLAQKNHVKAGLLYRQQRLERDGREAGDHRCVPTDDEEQLGQLPPECHSGYHEAHQGQGCRGDYL